jgi:hypothetical protein
MSQNQKYRKPSLRPHTGTTEGIPEFKEVGWKEKSSVVLGQCNGDILIKDEKGKLWIVDVCTRRVYEIINGDAEPAEPAGYREVDDTYALLRESERRRSGEK